MASDIVERLRARGHETWQDAETSKEAADEIERLRAEIKLIVMERDRTFALMLHRAEKAEAALERAAVHFESLNKQAYAVIARAALAGEKKNE